MLMEVTTANMATDTDTTDMAMAMAMEMATVMGTVTWATAPITITVMT